MISDLEYATLIGMVAFNFCMSIVAMLFILKLYLDIYHIRWLDILHDIEIEFDQYIRSDKEKEEAGEEEL